MKTPRESEIIFKNIAKVYCVIVYEKTADFLVGLHRVNKSPVDHLLGQNLDNIRKVLVGLTAHNLDKDFFPFFLSLYTFCLNFKV